MLRILKRAASCGSASVSTLTSRACGSRSLAACSKVGAIIRQGPHHGAQKSTTTGRSLRVMWRSKWVLPSSSGSPVNSGRLHCPHCGPSPSLAEGMRLTAAQCGQTTCRFSDISDSVHQIFLMYGRQPKIQPALRACAEFDGLARAGFQGAGIDARPGWPAGQVLFGKVGQRLDPGFVFVECRDVVIFLAARFEKVVAAFLGDFLQCFQTVGDETWA